MAEAKMMESAKGVLGSWIIDGARVGMLLKRNGVTVNWFAEKAHREIFVGMAELAEKTGGAVDLMLVVEHLRAKNVLEQVGGVEALTKIVDETPTAAHAEYYLDVLRQGWMARAADKAIEKFREEGPTGGTLALGGSLGVGPDGRASGRPFAPSPVHRGRHVPRAGNPHPQLL